jgi:hypothetical protein
VRLVFSNFFVYQKLCERFKTYGDILSFKVVRRRGRSTFAYANYKDADSAARAMEAAKDITLSNGNKPKIEPFVSKEVSASRYHGVGVANAVLKGPANALHKLIL